MKIGIVGSGLVGATAAYALVMSGVGREIVLVDKNSLRAEAEADDIFHAVPFAAPLDVNDGDYADLTGCRVVIIAAGVNQQPGETRLQLLERNAAIFRAIIPQILHYAPDSVLVVATNPVDITTHLTAQIAASHGLPRGRVFGSGTTLDTARFRVLLGRHVGVDSRHVHGYVVGEHGDSEVLLWSSVTIGGLPLLDYCRYSGVEMNEAVQADIDERVRRAAYHIIGGKGATYYGIGSALARICDVVLHDQRAIMTVCSPIEQIGGVEDVTLAMPHLIGGEGILQDLPVPMTDAETDALQRSARILRDAIDSLGL
jgi:L-lactate dehydrogenase